MLNFNRRHSSELDSPANQEPETEKTSSRFDASGLRDELLQETSENHRSVYRGASQYIVSKVPKHVSLRTIGIGVLIVIALLILSRFDALPFGGLGAGTYQAVFLSNGQVYFGMLSHRKSQYPTLTNIYYLQTGQQLQPSATSPNVSLVKLGDELHGPADTMRINRDHIVFIEDLKPDSQVVALIEEAQGQ